MSEARGAVLLFPWSALTQEGKPSPKNYPYWPEVVRGLGEKRWTVAQVSRKGEPGIPGVSVARHDDVPLATMAEWLRTCPTWLSVDSFLPHMAWTLGEPGVVVFGQSDPEIFGHPQNINLLKSRRYLRRYQFQFWHQVEPDPEAWVPPDQVVVTALLSIERRGRWV